MYQKRKQALREEAIEWQLRFCDSSYTWAELNDFCDYFTRLGKRYGLLKEFRMNGIL